MGTLRPGCPPVPWANVSGEPLVPEALDHLPDLGFPMVIVLQKMGESLFDVGVEVREVHGVLQAAKSFQDCIFPGEKRLLEFALGHEVRW
jgi:hypothetical protein